MRYVIYSLLISLLGFVYSCADDKGNYDYVAMNKLVISGIEVKYEKISHVDTLRIQPEIFNADGSECVGEYRYEWKFIPNNAQQPELGEEEKDYVVATTKDLDLPIALDAGKFTCFFNVEDLETKLVWGYEFEMDVKSLTSAGWMILCEQNGQTRMDMIVDVDENTDIITRDIWSESELETGKPLKVMYSYSFAALRPNVFTCEKGSYMLDPKDMHAGEDNHIRWYFGSQPDQVIVHASSVMVHNFYDWSFYPHYWIIVDDKGDVYCTDAWVVGAVFDFPVNEIDGVRFEAAPFVGNARRYLEGPFMQIPSSMLYDKAGRFIEVKVTSGGRPTVMKFEKEKYFSAEQPGKEMVMMQSTVYNGLTYAVLKDGNGDYYYYGIKLGNLGVNTQEYYGKISGPDLDQATNFTCHPVLGILYYATKDRIYKLDMKNPSGQAESILYYPGETISVMKFNAFSTNSGYKPWQAMRSEHLVVGTTVDSAPEDKCGIMRTYEFKTQWDREPVKLKEHVGLGKIVDIGYKETDN